MSDDRSPRWALPLLQPGQAQKEMFHNEALVALDLVAQAAVIAADAVTPPASPAEGDCWLLGAAPTGAWAGHAGELAGWTAAGWRFAAPVEGMTVWVAADGLVARWYAGGWVIGEERAARVVIDGNQVLGARRPAIATPSGGTVIDAESRTALTAILATLRTHGLIEN